MINQWLRSKLTAKLGENENDMYIERLRLEVLGLKENKRKDKRRKICRANSGKARQACFVDAPLLAASATILTIELIHTNPLDICDAQDIRRV